MGILLIILLLLIAGLCLVLLFKFLKWVVQKKERWYWMLAVLITITIGVTVNKLFFIKMEFIQSNVYPHVYLVKNQIENKDSLQVIIKKMVVQKMNDQINGSEEILKTKYKYAYRSVPEINSSIRFYEYYKSLGVIPFGEAGTAHFIDNEEDPGGFTSELLQHYRTYKIAEFSMHYCENDTTNYFGKLTYWKNGEIIKTETLFNSCKNE